MGNCHYCGPTGEEMRPYGPEGADVCYPCATATPERNAETLARYQTLVEAAVAVSPTGLIAIGEETGPRPFDPREAP